MIRPNIGQVSFQVVEEFGGCIVQTVMPDAEYGWVGLMRVGLDEGMRHKESIRGINYEMEGKDDLSQISGMPLKIVFGSHLNRGRLCECEVLMDSRRVYGLTVDRCGYIEGLVIVSKSTNRSCR